MLVLIKEAIESEKVGQESCHSPNNSLESVGKVAMDDEEDGKKESSGPTHRGNDPEAHANTYFVDAREPEPEELRYLLSDPLPPPGYSMSAFYLLFLKKCYSTSFL